MSSDAPRITRRSLCAGGALASLIPHTGEVHAAPTVWESLPDLPDAALQDHEGRNVRFLRDLLQNRVFVLNFIFTSCTTVCPPQTALLKQARDALPATAMPLVWLSLSVDPVSDTPEMLSVYRKKFAIPAGLTPWHFLTGEPNTVARLRSAWGDKTGNPNDHLSRLIVGSAVSRRYTRLDAFVPPHVLIQRLQELM